jgi:inositol transport system substrate-binding protein
MRKLIALFLMAMLLLSTTAISPALAEQAKVYKVAFICRNTADSFCAFIIQAFNDTMKKDYEGKMTLDILDSNADNEKENSLIETCVTNGYDAIIVQPNDSDSQLPYCQAAVDAGKVVVTTNAGIREVNGGYWVDADPYEQGKLVAEKAIAEVPQNGKVCIMTCNPGNLHTESRLKAYKEIFLAQRPDVTCLAEKCTARADESEFMSTMEDWVQAYGKFDAVLTIGDSLAKACYEVVKDDPSWDNALFYGVDGNPDQLLLIKQGHIQGTVMQDTYDIAGNSLKTAYTALTTGKADNVALPATYIDATNIDQYLEYYVKIGRLTQDEVDQAIAEMGA